MLSSFKQRAKNVIADKCITSFFLSEIIVIALSGKRKPHGGGKKIVYCSFDVIFGGSQPTIKKKTNILKLKRKSQV